MKATRNQYFSDADLDACCDECGEQLKGGAQLWTIDHDHSYGFFCSKDCAEKNLKAQLED